MLRLIEDGKPENFFKDTNYLRFRQELETIFPSSGKRSSFGNFLPAISIKAKDFAAEMTSVNVQSKDLHGETAITREHVDNNAAVRKMLTERGIVPENLPPAEDVKKVERRLASEEKKMLGKKK